MNHLNFIHNFQEEVSFALLDIIFKGLLLHNEYCICKPLTQL